MSEVRSAATGKTQVVCHQAARLASSVKCLVPVPLKSLKYSGDLPFFF